MSLIPYRIAQTWSLVLLFLLVMAVPSRLRAEPQLGGANATTESSCNFGMAKGQARGSCRVPIPDGCIVAHQPGGTKPWANISKGGNTVCRFNDKETDWTTRITGSCDRCKTVQCSARFGVMFDCTATSPPPVAKQKP